MTTRNKINKKVIREMRRRKSKVKMTNKMYTQPSRSFQERIKSAKELD